ncbi:cysteine desulfurase [Candidatus Dependentiae bacterium]|nr:cysteine desulfurase [Candidatus Dependentiae bacterium]
MSKNNINIQKFRSFFPILKTKINNYPLVYFDNAATAQVPYQVIEAMNDYYAHYKSNVGRGIYTFAERTTAEYERARLEIAKFIGVDPQNIVFTSGATDSINLVAKSWAAYNLQRSDEIIISAVEHHSNFLPWQELASKLNLTLKIIPVTKQGNVDLDQFKAQLTSKTKLVAIVHSSNVVGGTNDVRLITQLAHQVGAAVLVDACQSIAHQKIDVEIIGSDFLVFSGHKLFGPTGIGVLYAKSERINQMRPTEFGGGMVFSVNFKNSEYRSFPKGFEAGTPNIAGAIGLAAAVKFIEREIDFKMLAEYETMLVNRMIQGLLKIPGIQLISFNPIHEQSAHAHLVTFVSNAYHAHDIAAYLDQYGIAVRAGHHCVQLYHQQCNINASVRCSFSGYNTIEEVDFVLEKLQTFLQTK